MWLLLHLMRALRAIVASAAESTPTLALEELCALMQSLVRELSPYLRDAHGSEFKALLEFQVRLSTPPLLEAPFSQDTDGTHHRSGHH